MALDGIGEKLKSLFKPKEDSRFKGQGRKLGSAEVTASGARPPQHQARGNAPSGSGGSSGDGMRRPLIDTVAVTSVGPILPLQPPPQPLGTGGLPSGGLLLSRSHRTEDVVLDAAVMANTPTGREAQLVGAHKLPASPTSLAGTASLPCSPTAQSHQSATPPLSTSRPATPCSPAAAAAAAVGGAGGVSPARRLGMTLKVEVPTRSGGGGGGEGGGTHGPSHLNPAHPSHQHQHQQQQQQGPQEPHQRTSSGNNRRLQSRATSNLSSIVSTISTPTAAEKRIGGGFRCHAPPTDGAMADYGVAPATSEAYELQRCLALVLSSRPAPPPPPSRAPSAPNAATPLPLALAPTPAAAQAGGSGPDPGSTTGPPPAPDPSVSAASSETTPTTATGTPLPPSSRTSSGLDRSDSTPSTTSSKTPAPDGEAAAGSSAAAPPAGSASTAGGTGGAPASASASLFGGGGFGGCGGGAGPRECCDALLRVLGNVMTKPGEAKYRQIRLSNPKVQETIVGVPGAVEFLEAAGFKMQFHPDDGSENANQGSLVLPDEVPPTALAEAFRILSAAMAAHGFTAPAATPAAPTATDGQRTSASQQQLLPPRPSPAAKGGLTAAAAAASASAAAAAAASAAPPVDRCTQVVLPAAPDAQVPDWFFERTGTEIRAQWQSMVRSRQEAEQFMTRTMREVRRQQLQAQQEAEAAGGRGAPADVATVRVRFPEGVCLQGHFGAGEPISRIFEWVAAALRSPALTFELIKPDRRPLAATAPAAAAAKAPAAPGSRPGGASGGGGGAVVPLTVRSADLMPSVLLNLRPVGQEAAALGAANLPLLSDAMLRTTRPQ